MAAFLRTVSSSWMMCALLVVLISTKCQGFGVALSSRHTTPRFHHGCDCASSRIQHVQPAVSLHLLLPRPSFHQDAAAESTDEEAAVAMSATSITNRRQAMRQGFTAALGMLAMTTTTTVSPQPAIAADAPSLTIYNTGKAPKVPGEKPRDKSEVKGTKRDPPFLRSISDCKVR
jgi:hypothetical protein